MQLNETCFQTKIRMLHSEKKYSECFSEITNYLKTININELETIFKPLSKILNDVNLKAKIIDFMSKHILEVRENDKFHSLQLCKIYCYLTNSEILRKELAICYMHCKEWKKAIEEFEYALFIQSSKFSAQQYHRLLKSYEMADIYDNYTNIVFEIIQKFPQDNEVHWRMMNLKIMKDIQNEDYRSALETITLVLKSNHPMLWGINKEDLYKKRDICIKNTTLLPFNKQNSKKKILAIRDDGLGQRLVALCNAIILAKTFGYEFGYNWKSHLWDTGVDNSNNKVIDLAMDSEQAVFSKKFIEKYSVSQEKYASKKFIELGGRKFEYPELFQLEQRFNLDGFYSPQELLDLIFINHTGISKSFTFKDAFELIDFSDELKLMINLANHIAKKQKFVALHLRSGDVVFGEARKRCVFAHKVITIPIAKEIIKRYKEQNLDVIIFGQNIDVLDMLKQEFNVQNAQDIINQNCTNFTQTQKAFFEIILMSKAQEIISSNSGFSKTAAKIQDKDIINYIHLFKRDEYAKIILQDLQKNSDKYHRLETAIAYWSCYYHSKAHLNFEQTEKILKNLVQLDETNYIYHVILISEYCKNDMLDKANYVFENMLQTKEFNLLDFSKCINLRFFGPLVIAPQIPYLAKASQTHTFAKFISLLLPKDIPLTADNYRLFKDDITQKYRFLDNNEFAIPNISQYNSASENKYKKYFVTFADSQRLAPINRIVKEAVDMNFFDGIFAFTENELDENFKSSFKDKLIPSKGFGYWCWKPQVILQALEKIQDGDILLYCEVGCQFKKANLRKLDKYFELTNNSDFGILSIDGDTHNWLEREWTKGDLFDYFGVRNNQEVTNSTQRVTTVIYIKKNTKTLQFLQKWKEIFYNNFSLIDDTTSKSPNFKDFKEHRYDQSIYSILGKLNKVSTISDSHLIDSSSPITKSHLDKVGKIKNEEKEMLNIILSNKIK